MKRKYTGLYFVLPGFAGVLLFYLIPFADVVHRSFCSAVGGKFVGMANYKRVLENAAFRLAAANTGRFLMVCIPCLLLLSLMAALGIWKMSALRWLKNLYLIPFVIPSAAVALLWKLVFDYHGFLNGILAGVTEPIDWMNSKAAFAVLVFAYIWKNMGCHVVLWLAGLQSVPKSVCEAAGMDGAGEKELFFYIMLPCMKPVTFMIVVISILNSFKVFREAWMVAGNYPQESIYLLQHLFNNWFSSLSMDKLTAGAMLLAAAVLGLVWILKLLWEREKTQ